jgi:hypothetical protein
LHINVVEGELISPHGEFDALGFSGRESDPSKSFQLFHRESHAGAAEADIEFYNLVAGARAGISDRGGNVQCLRRLLVEAAGA